MFVGSWVMRSFDFTIANSNDSFIMLRRYDCLMREIIEIIQEGRTVKQLIQFSTWHGLKYEIKIRQLVGGCLH